MTEPNREEQQHVAAISKERLLVLVALGVLGASIFYSYLKSDSAATDLTQQNIELRKGLENANVALAELKQAELRRLEEESVNASAVEERMAQLDHTEAQLPELREVLESWLRTQAELESGELGRRIASSPEELRQYQALQSQAKLDPGLAEKLQARLDLLRKPLLEAQASDLKAYRPGPDFDQTLLGIQQDVAEALADIRLRTSHLAAIVAQAPAEPSPDALPLPEALRAMDNAFALEQAEQVMDAVQKVRQEMNEKLAAEKAETERIRAQMELDREQHKREMEALSQRTQSQQLAEDLKRVREEQESAAARRILERQFEQDLPEIKSLLRPFITEGRTQPGKSRFEMSVDVGPVSYSKLQAAGVLQRSVEAQRKLWSMTTANKTNDRDLGAFPPYFGSSQDWFNKQPTVARAQELLNKYGALLVEKGMLAP